MNRPPWVFDLQITWSWQVWGKVCESREARSDAEAPIYVLSQGPGRRQGSSFTRQNEVKPHPLEPIKSLGRRVATEKIAMDAAETARSTTEKPQVKLVEKTEGKRGLK